MHILLGLFSGQTLPKQHTQQHNTTLQKGIPPFSCQEEKTRFDNTSHLENNTNRVKVHLVQKTVNNSDTTSITLVVALSISLYYIKWISIVIPHHNKPQR